MRRLLPWIAGLLCLSTAGSNEDVSTKRDHISHAIRQGLPRYDAAQATPRVPAERGRKPTRMAEHAKPARSLTDEERAAPQTTDSIIHLDPMVIRSKPEQRRRLPRVSVPPPVRDLKTVPFESDGARDERLVQKHHSKLDQVLNGRLPWLKKSLVQRARSAEAAENRARLLSEISFLLELGALIDGNEEQTPELLSEYMRLYHTRPE